jgi:hypothetical protein
VRVAYPGEINHLTVRANGGAELFEDDDRRYLLRRSAAAASTYQVRVYLFSIGCGRRRESVAKGRFRVCGGIFH